MKIESTKNNGHLEVSLDGRLDTVTAPELESFLSEHYNSISVLTLNLAKLTYISSAGLRVLLSAHKKTKGAMKLTNVGEIVMDVLEMTGFADVLNID